MMETQAAGVPDPERITDQRRSDLETLIWSI